MNDHEHKNEAACGGSALTAELGTLADQFECHALSRGIGDIEAAGRAMRAAKAEIERLREAIAALLACPSGMYCDAYQAAEKQARALLVPNA